ncbi:class I SAM-dependent methyltransferase [Bradyrhizobium sp. 31Argb]|uniref:class I SAM-dependent methyltransferase n=1 Tax=Bradyrhizobium sp. 31Argb TaxID=3141247 RepID=UPI00374A8A9E
MKNDASTGVAPVSEILRHFSDPAAVARYAEDTPRKVPGFADLQRMAALLLAERAPEAADVLVLGAGGGLELKAFAEARPRWGFTGIDPSAEMLDLARNVLGPLASRVRLVQGFIEDAPAGPFDGATCLLTLHFLSKPGRLRTLCEMRRRLKPGAALVVAHHSRPPDGALGRWLTRSVMFANGTGADPAQVAASAASMAQRLPILFAEDDEALLEEAGFSDVALFYAGFTFRGWVAAA